MGAVLFLARVGQKIFDTRRRRVPPGPGINSPSYAREAGESDVRLTATSIGAEPMAVACKALILTSVFVLACNSGGSDWKLSV
jgi:hypothetical protein